MTKQYTKYYVGCDVSKRTLDIHIRPTGDFFAVNNDHEGILKLLTNLKPLKPELIVMEATGGLETLASEMLDTEGLPVLIINPKKIRGFAEAIGRQAKTDRIDAEVIARFAETVRPEIRKLPDPSARELADLTIRRVQLLKMRTAEKTRLPHMNGYAQESVRRMISLIGEQIDEVEEQTLQLINSCPVMKKKAEILKSIPGVGQVISSVIISQMPELGQLDRKKIAALAGLAPFNRDSGRTKRLRHISGGRAAIRSQLYMGILSATQYNPVIKAFYRRLLEAGKIKKVAVIACARKLLVIANAMVKNNSLWNKNYTKSS